eukprot:335060-Chlamydomonas_euryale.AAC.2
MRRLRSVLDKTLSDVLPHDIHERCNGTCHIAVTHVWPTLKPQLVSQFDSRRQLIDTLLTSCHIPWCDCVIKHANATPMHANA